MGEGHMRACQRRAWELRAAAAATRLWAADVQARSRELCAEARRRCLACCMPGANRLTVAITAQSSSGPPLHQCGIKPAHRGQESIEAHPVFLWSEKASSR
jgi:hypothetical protein